ncbi:unnamed protein product [Prorocentrum cordatum]|uniref:Endonuclease/exonuclease/phosphatase domain-containing protein n=1 Tax=Prorocentrum cordatum TaxID=2364126 RepID=A0ABN9SJU8_9DINO|nr:unnamed protein product [Polarella glacialis]
MLDKKNPDYDWWGAAVNWEWAGVVPDSKWMENVTSYEDLPVLWNATTAHVEPLHIKVLTYNLYWWSLFEKNGGSDGAAGKLVAESGNHTPYDLMAFQECENIDWVLGDAGLSDSYEYSEVFYSICLAWRNETWRKLVSGYDAVATDGGWVRNNKWGDRIVSWARLEHRETGDKLFFANHHGPLPLNSGGEAGGLATAHNLLAAIKAHAEEGDVIVFTGDFNSDYRSATVKMLSTRLILGYHGESFGGIDNIFANTGKASFTDRRNLGGAGSDHDALTATVVVPTSARAVAALAAGARKEAVAKAAAAREAEGALRGQDGPPGSKGLGQENGGAGRAVVLAAPVGLVALALWGWAA